jgi:hypothetical protein
MQNKSSFNSDYVKTSTIVKSLNVLIIIAIIMAIGTVAVVAITIVQSAPSISLGQVLPTVTGNITRVDIPVTISNRGYLAFADINAMLSLKNSNGTMVGEGSGGPLTIPAGSTRTFVITITIDTANIPQELLQDLMTNNQNLTVNASLGGTIPPMVHFAVSASGNLYWGAPITDLTAGTLQASVYNTTHARVTLPFSFKDNSAYIPVQGTLTSTILLTNGTEVGVQEAYTLNVSPGATLSGNLIGYIKNEAVGQSSYTLRLTFQTSYGSVIKEMTLHA